MSMKDFKREVKRILPLPIEFVYNYIFTVEKSEGRYDLKVECYKESTGETYLVA